GLPARAEQPPGGARAVAPGARAQRRGVRAPQRNDREPRHAHHGSGARAMTAAGRPEPLLISLTGDGRLVDRASVDRFGRELAGVTDCFVFCLGWLYDEAEAREEAARFFALLDIALGSLRER